MICPVCAGPAEDITLLTFDGKSIRCTKCGDYDISGTVWDPGAFRSLHPEERAAVLKKAKQFAQPGARPMISSDCL